MLQKEVVERMCAEPDSDGYGRLTVALAARAVCQKLFLVGPGSFNPPPKVHSAIVRLTPRATPFVIKDLPSFDRIVTAAFSQRRKTLSNALKGLLSADAIRAAGINPQIRAEALAPEAFGQLSLQLP
jgi:16S rRNA (adenine1518-N6/adenine1519-N6)-dimethyltransferase